MDILPELEARRAYRALSSEALPGDVVRRLLEVAVLAPSCANNQPWRMVAVRRQEETHAAMAGALLPGNSWGAEAPLFVVFATKPSLDCRLEEGRDYAYFDVGQAVMAFQLQAIREGLHVHPIAGFTPSKVKVAVGLPEDFVPLVVVIVGRPGDTEALPDHLKVRERAARTRKPLADVAYAGTFGTPFGS